MVRGWRATKEPTVVVVKSGEYQVLQAEDAAE